MSFQCDDFEFEFILFLYINIPKFSSVDFLSSFKCIEKFNICAVENSTRPHLIFDYTNKCTLYVIIFNAQPFMKNCTLEMHSQLTHFMHVFIRLSTNYSNKYMKHNFFVIYVLAFCNSYNRLIMIYFIVILGLTEFRLSFLTFIFILQLIDLNSEQPFFSSYKSVKKYKLVGCMIKLVLDLHSNGFLDRPITTEQ